MNRLETLGLLPAILAFSLLAACGQPGKQTSAASEYEFQAVESRPVMWFLPGQGYCYGRVNASGSFVPNELTTPERGEFGSFKLPLIVPLRGEVAYEFRSGMLIKGTADAKWNFVPEIGSEVIPFEDYKYSKDAPRIYNLPGRFVEKKK